MAWVNLLLRFEHKGIYCLCNDNNERIHENLNIFHENYESNSFHKDAKSISSSKNCE